MASFRNYYSPALDQSINSWKYGWSNNDETPESTRGIGAGTFGLGIGAAALAGKIPVGKGRVWDYYVGGFRHFEEYFLGRIPRTLQLSNIFSQYETASLATRHITPTHLKDYTFKQLDYLERLTGTSEDIIRKHGLRFENNKLFLGGTNQALLEHASVIRNLNKSPRFSTGYARSLGQELRGASNLFEETLKFNNAAGKEVSEVFQFIGGKTRTESIKRFWGGIGTELVERVNRLSASPFDFPLVGPLLSKLPRLDVPSGKAIPTLARMIGKLGIVAGVGYMGYQQLDYGVRNSSIFDNTNFDQGITAGAANMWASANIAYAQFGEATGLSAYARRQEEIAPGSTSIQHLLTFPIAGMLVGASLHYMQRAALTARLQMGKKIISETGLPTRVRQRTISEASETAAKIMSRFHSNGAISWIGRKFKNATNPIIKSITANPLRIMGTIGAVAASLPILPFIPGAIAPQETPQELQDIYSGKTEIAIRKGRWWEFGRQPYEGSNIDYFREHWVARANIRAKEKAIWGPLEEEGEISPFKKWFTENFTNDLEHAHYSDRPYPITGGAFSNVPVIGPVLSATIGRLFKSPQTMHQDEWMQGGEYKQLPAGFGQTSIPGQGSPSNPVSPFNPKGIIGEQIYRGTEFVGLPGFLTNLAKEKITGSQDFFDQETQLASASEIYSASRGYYDESLGGMVGTGELFRRFIPHERKQIPQYNPIRNDMPDWLPGPNERGPDLLHGDPYAALATGEERLPGAGYAARFPELEGIDPANYPLIHRYKILADVAPYTTKFDDTAKDLAIEFKSGNLSEEDQAIYKSVQEQVRQRRDKKTFYDYKYREHKLTDVQQALSDWNKSQSDDSGPSWFEKTMGSFWENIAHNVDSPIEQLTPLSPAAKLLHMRTATEDYERTQVYGTESAFWNRPWENFIKPFGTTAAQSFGWDGIPEKLQEKRKLEEYFDILKYTKFTRLKRMAQQSGDIDASTEFEQKRRETLFGVNPYTYDYTEIFRALPRKERDYFNDFTNTKDTDERARIYNLIPDNEKGLYMARWQQQDSLDFQKANKLGLLSEEQIQKGQAKLEDMYEDMSTEGLPKSQDLWQEFIATRQQGESYPDWYRRTKLLVKKAEELGVNIPGADWVGWHPSVDLDDVKLKLVENLGESIQDYDLWPTRERQLRYKQQFVNEESLEPIMEQSPSTEQIRQNIHSLLSEYNIEDSDINISSSSNPNSIVNIDISEDRTADLKNRLREMNG